VRASGDEIDTVPCGCEKGENDTTKNKEMILMRRSAKTGREGKTEGKVEGNKEWEAIVSTTY